jgi:23S rRNA (cytosine1962-C5)-methyltransferase
VTYPTVTIRPGREKPIRQGHPWIFSGAVLRAENAGPGDIVTVQAGDGAFLARGYWNPTSQIQVRILTWRDEPTDTPWWQQMLARAIQTRLRDNDPSRRDSCRLVHAENDFLPGLIVDRYADWLVLQALTLHIDQHKHHLAEILAGLLNEAGSPVKGIYERSDVDVRRREGLELVTGLLWGDEPPELITPSRATPRYYVDIRQGHKTGFYLDQQPNYRILGDLMSSVYGFDPDTRLLNLFSYTGRFGLETPGYVVNVDSSPEAQTLARRNYALNDYPPDRAEFVQADVFDYLRRAVQRGELHDVIILDPPKFAHNKQQVDKASRGYKDINLNAFKLVKPGGHLMTFSCSGAISADLFQKIVFGALIDSGRQAQIIRHLGPGDDHPVALTFPEGTYLKGLLLRVY